MARKRTLGTLDLGMIDRLRLGWRLLRDPRIPAWPKWLIPAGALIYALSPVDLLPDIFPIIGQIDDVSIIALAFALVTMLVKWSPQEVVAEHAADLGIHDGLPTTPERGAPRTSERAKSEPVEAKYWVDDWR